MIVVSNTSPIINLAQIGQLDLLKKLYGTVLIPSAVYDEIVIDGVGQPGAEEVVEYDWIQLHSISNMHLVEILEQDLDRGEAQAVALATELDCDLLLIDEQMGRKIAVRLGLSFTGIVGILLAAKKQGLIQLVKPLLDDLINIAGFWVSLQLYTHALESSGES